MVGRTDTANSDSRGWGWGFASVGVCARACMHACVHDVFAIYDNDILPMLIMIIINIIILYFIQIRHTDDFPSTGTGLVCITFQTSDPNDVSIIVFSIGIELLGVRYTRQW